MLSIVGHGARIRRAAFWSRDAGCIVAGDVEADEQNLAQSVIFLTQPHGGPKVHLVEWLASTACVLPGNFEGALVAEERGRLLTVTSTGIAEDRLVFADGTKEPLIISSLALIFDRIFAVGMRGLIASRREDGLWDRISGPDSALPGLEGLGGPSLAELYALGWGGALAWVDQGRWREVSMPSSVILTGIAVDDFGQCYICGQAGILLRGRHDQWELICENETDEDIWSVAWYRGYLYVATILTLYVVEGDELVRVKFDDDPPTSCYSLTVVDGCLFSIGREDLLRFDGRQWDRIA